MKLPSLDSAEIEKYRIPKRQELQRTVPAEHGELDRI